MSRVSRDRSKARLGLDVASLLAILDLGMPKASGLDVARWVRQQPWDARVRLIAVSGWGQDEDRQATREAGLDAHLVKPVTADEAFRALSRDAPGA
jgi:CheY-like chemotaxis protein